MAFLAGIVIASFLFLLLLIKRKKNHADYILLIWMLLIVMHTLLFYLHFQGIAYKYPHTLGLILPLPVLHGVILYFYTCALTRTKIVGFWLLHLIPFLVLVGLAMPFYSLSGEEKLEVFRNEGRGYEWYGRIQLTTIYISGFAYSILSILVIHRHRIRIQENFSNTDRMMLRWLEYLVYGLGIIWLLAMFTNEVVLFLGVVGFVLFIGFFGINQIPIFVGQGARGTAEPEVPLDTTAPRYAKSGLTEIDAAELFGQLERMMDHDRLYAKTDLSLQDLAAQLDVPPNQLSQVINSQAQKTFYHYINTKRLEGFLERASRPDSKRYTFLALAHDCGFNSKTTFNKYFKLQTGKTPSEYFGDPEKV